MTDLSRVRVIAPNFKRRLSGVTSTVARLVPLQARMIPICACAPRMPPDVPNVSWWRLLTMSRAPLRVWHARRNVEMIAGLALKWLLGKRLRLVFTSASQRVHTRLTRALIARMDAVVATSERSARYLDRPAQVIRHGIDAEAFAPAPDRMAVRAQLGLPVEGPLIGCFGRIRAQKGTDVFVHTAMRLAQAHPTVTAIVMGRATGAHARFAEALARDVASAGLSRRILFLPEVPVWKTARFYQALDLYVAPQRWEGFGLTPLEAMATGAPVVATRVGAFEELIVQGQTGLLVKAGDVQALTDAAGDLLADPGRLRAMRDAARAHVAQNFTLQGEAEALVALYRGLLDRAG